MGAIQKAATVFKLIPTLLSQLGKVLHHSTAWNPNRDEYLVAFDLDVDKDGIPDQLYALRFDTSGGIVDRRMLNFTANLNNKAGILYSGTPPYGHPVITATSCAFRFV